MLKNVNGLNNMQENKMSKQQNTQQPVAWEYFDGTWYIGVDGERENYEMFGYPTRDLYTAPPVPRDVLSAAKKGE